MKYKGLKRSLNVAFIFIAIVTIFYFVKNFSNGVRDYSMQAVVQNYFKNKLYFEQIVSYVNNNGIEPFSEVTFLNDSMILCYLYHSPIGVEPSCMIVDYLENDATNLRLLPNKEMEISFNDSLYILNSWSWLFEGSPVQKGYNIILEYLNISKKDIHTLGVLVKKSNCKSIGIDESGNIFLRFSENMMCRTDYIILKAGNSLNSDYIELDDNVCFRLQTDSLFCGECNWSD
jgi:hypothetical protein